MKTELGKKRPLNFRKGFNAKDESGLYLVMGDRLPSVTKITEPFKGDFTEAHIAVIGKEVCRLADLAKQGQNSDVWTQTEDGWVKTEIKASHLLMDGKHVSNAGRRYMKSCADRGNVIDELLMRYAEGMDADTSQIEEAVQMVLYGKPWGCTIDDCAPFAKSLQKYLDDHNPQYVYGQFTVVNSTLLYAGKPDYIRMDENGKFVLQSLKTTFDEGRFERAWLAQEAFYAFSNHALFVDDKTGELSRLAMPKVRGVEWLILTPDGYRVRYAPKALLKEWYDGFCTHAANAYHSFKSGPLPAKASKVARW